MFTTFTSKRILTLVVPVSVLIIFLYFFYIPLNPISQNLKKKKTLIEPFCPHENKLILFWTKYFEVDDFYFGFGPKPFQECEVVTCCTTRNRSRFDQSDAVVFHIRDVNLQDMPTHRLINQRWIFFLLESPHHTPYILKNLGNIFNWTMTYRIDSDIYTPYPVVSIEEINQKPVNASQTGNTASYDLRNMVQKKKKLVAWFVSNCKTPSAREKYVAELQKYVQVDVYGACGPFKCFNHMECYKMMGRDYKFYLAFENSICRDYVTEKFYNALLFKTVPIVYGGANYTAMAPKMSYINVRDFQSVKHLAEYLKFLDGNDNAYMRYFDWRQTPPGLSLLPRGLHSWCSLCNMLHNDSLPTRSYSDIHSWWFDKGGCEKDRTQPFT